MDRLNALMSCPFTLRLGWSLVHFIWEGALLAGVLAVLLWMLRRRSANSRYLASAGALLAMAAAIPVSYMSLSASATARSSEKPIATAPPLVIADVPVADALPVTSELQPTPPAAPTQARFEPATPPLETHNWHHNAMARVDRILPWAVAAWIIGVLLLSLRLAAGWLIVQRMRRRLVEPASMQIAAVVGELAKRLGLRRAVRVVISKLADVPSTVGSLRPLILLPTSAITGLSTEQLEAIIAHELAHIRRYDYLVNLLQSAVETVLFYHPAVWWVSHRMRVEREHCCDDLAVSVCGNPVVYARALSQMESCRHTPRLLAAASGGPLLMRVRRILGIQAPAGNHFSRYAAGLLVVMVLAAFAATVELSATSAVAADASASSQPADTRDAEPADMRNQPHRWRHFERIVVGKDAITFEGVLTDWDHVGELMKPDSKRTGSLGSGAYGHTAAATMQRRREVLKLTVLEIARASNDLPEDVFNAASDRAERLAQEYGYEYVSHIGVKPLGSKGSESQYLPQITKHGRWRHFVRYLADQRGGLGIVDESSAGVKDLPRSDSTGPMPGKLPEPQWTMLEITTVPNSTTTEQYAAAKQKAAQIVARMGMEGVIDLGIRPSDQPASPTVFIADENQPGEWTHYVTLVVGKNSQTYQGESIGWDELKAKVAAIPDKPHTCFCMAVASDELEGQRQEIRQLLGKLGIEQFSYIGVHPLGTKGGPSIFTPTAPAGPKIDRTPAAASQPGETRTAVGSTGTGPAKAKLPETYVYVRSLASGLVTQVLVKSGQQVHKGDVLVQLDDAEIKLELEDAQTRLDSATRQVRHAEQAQKAGLIDTENYLKNQEAQKLAELDVRRRTLQLERTRIKSPCDGIVSTTELDLLALTGKQVQPGDFVVSIRTTSGGTSQTTEERPEVQDAPHAGAPSSERLRYARPEATPIQSRSAQYVRVRSLTAGLVTEVLVKPLQHVHKGDVLVRLDDAEIKIQVELAKSRLESARKVAEVAGRRAASGAAGMEDRLAILAVKPAELELELWTLRLDRTQIKSPCDGVVEGDSDPQQFVGQPIEAGQPLAVIRYTPPAPGETPAATQQAD